MKPKLKRVRDQVIVVTGATSGIGLATARLAARKGARVVLCSRNEGQLRKVCNEIKSKGQEAHYVVADVSKRDDMEHLAREAYEKYGRIDTWINNAAISIYGKSEDVRENDLQRLMEVNFYGMVYGCQAALPYLREQGGSLINVGSMVSDKAVPLLGIYSSSKHAVKAYTHTLRMELEKEGAPISVTLVKPASINTHFTEHAKTYGDLAPTFPAPVYSPEVAARAILNCAEHPRKELVVGGSAAILSLMGRLAPRFSEFLIRKTLFRAQLQNRPQNQRDIFDSPFPEETEHGEYPGHVFKTSLYTYASLHPVKTLLFFGSLGLLGLAAWRTIGRSKQELNNSTMPKGSLLPEVFVPAKDASNELV